MFDTQITGPAPSPATAKDGLPMAALDSETACLLRRSMLPVIDAAQSWPELSAALRAKGFGMIFREGRLIFSRLEDGQELCTARFLGAPLDELAGRLGRPNVRAGRDGRTGQLVV